jgi:8-hydroxy-5-deazaflavin:NADPH oxidoreductase
MIVTTIGVGNVGGALARLWIDAGYEVRAAGRQNCAQVVAVADVVALCVPWSAAEVALTSCGDLAGKILIDCTNPLASGLDGLVLGGTTSAAERIQSWHPNAIIVKAFNSTGAAMLGKGKIEGRLADGFYCGDSAAAKQVVGPLIIAAGLRPVDVGPLRNARYLEAMAMLWIDLAVNQKRGASFAFTLAGWSEAAP